jgi:hypothetical protein
MRIGWGETLRFGGNLVLGTDVEGASTTVGLRSRRSLGNTSESKQEFGHPTEVGCQRMHLARIAVGNGLLETLP